MFITLPLLLIAGSIIGIVLIVHRKLPYLKKLTPESHELGESIFHDFVPEIVPWFDQARMRHYRQITLKELEKFLRQLRVISLKIDHMSDSLIKKIRRLHITTHLEHAAVQQKSEESPPLVTVPAGPSVKDTAEELKSQEQKLIIEIAQNPKDPQLYETLGDLYLKMKNDHDAKEAFEAALGLNPHDQALARKYSRLLKKPEAVA